MKNHIRLPILFILLFLGLTVNSAFSQSVEGSVSFLGNHHISGVGGDPQAKSCHNNVLPQLSDSSLCAHLASVAAKNGGNGNYQKAYDTTRAFIEGCAYLSNSYRHFSYLDGYNAGRSDDLHRHEEYREWLKKVLYYNTDTLYYCQDVSSILETFGWFNDVRGNDMRGGLTVMYYIVKSGKCSSYGDYLDTGSIPPTWKALYNRWQDSVKDPINFPFDSTLPTLEDLGLGLLWGQSGVHVRKLPSGGLNNLSAVENPFSNDAILHFELEDAAFLKVEIFDVLGIRLYTDTKFFNVGKNDWKLASQNLQRCTLYARVSTLSGEVKTIKLIKQ